MPTYMALNLTITAENADTVIAQLKELGATAGGEAKEGVEGLGEATGSFNEIAAQLGVTLGMGGLIDILKDSVKEFANTEFAIRSMTAAMQAAGASAAELAANQGIVEEIHSRLPFSYGQLNEALQELFLRTGNVNAAQSLLNTASEIAFVRHRDVSTVVRALAAAYEGHAMMLSKLTGIYGDSTDVLDEVIARYNTLADSIGPTTLSALEQLTRDFSDQKDRIGDLVTTLPAYNALMKELSDTVKGMATFAEDHKAGLNAFVEAITGILDLGKFIVGLAADTWDGGVLIVKVIEWIVDEIQIGLRQITIAMADALHLPAAVTKEVRAEIDAIRPDITRLQNDMKDLLSTSSLLGVHAPAPAGAAPAAPVKPPPLKHPTPEEIAESIKEWNKAEDELEKQTKKGMDALAKGSERMWKEWMQYGEDAYNELMAKTRVEGMGVPARKEGDETGLMGQFSSKAAADAALQMQRIITAMKVAGEQMKTVNQSITQSIQQAWLGAFEAIGSAIGKIMAGGKVSTVFKELGAAILQDLGNMMKQQGEALLAYGIAMSKLAVGLSNPITAGPAAIAIGVLLVALGTALSSIGGKMGTTGGGGASSTVPGAYGGGYAVGSNTTQYVMPQPGQPFAAGHPYPGGPMQPNVTIIGTNDPNAMGQMRTFMRNMQRRGMLASGTVT